MKSLPLFLLDSQRLDPRRGGFGALRVDNDRRGGWAWRGAGCGAAQGKRAEKKATEKAQRPVRAENGARGARIAAGRYPV
ncbi:hypothetical protein [Phyllobacterium sp. K27]